MAKTIPLTQGKVALVNNADFKRVSAFNWYAVQANGVRPWRPVWYARRSAHGERPAVVYLHRFLMGAKSGQLVDHKNLDGLDCRRRNMRFATKSENALNSHKRRANGGR